jgi:hypothetical protein
MKRAVRRFARRWGRLYVLAATACAFLSAQLQVELHEAFVQHVVCAEHGGRLEDLPHAAASRTSDDKASTQKSVQATPATPEEHQACELPPGLTAGTLALSSPPVLYPAEVSFLDPQPPEGVPGRTGPPLLHEAPKLSPPRA